MRWGVLLVVALLGALAVATQVFAHADYDRSVPDRNEVVPEAPPQIDIWFGQDVRKVEGANSITVVDEVGARVNDDDGIVDDDDRTHMFTTVPAFLPPGRYVVEWMTTSDLDDDEDSGKFCFYIAVEPTAEQAAECAGFDAEQFPPTTTPPSAQPTEAGAAVTPTAAGAVDETPSVTPANGADNGDDGVSSGVIIAIVLGIVVVVVAVGAAALWLRRA